MSIKGSSRSWFEAAVQRGNITLVDQAAREMRAANGRLALGDALAVCIVLGVRDDDRYDRAAARWIARFALERPTVVLADVGRAVTVFDRLPTRQRASVAELVDVAAAHGVAAEGLRDLSYLDADATAARARFTRRPRARR